MDGWKQMGRAKIPIKWIPKDTSRNVTFMKRKKGLRKKVEELSILCGVEACMVCFGPQTYEQDSQDQHPDVWPNMSRALEVIERYRRLSKEEQDKKKLDNSSFLEQRIKKLKFELNMKRKENKDLEMDTMYPCWDNCLNYLSVEKLKDLLEYIDVKLDAVHDRINFVTRQENEISHAAENNIVPFTEMEYIARQPLMEPCLQNLMMSMGMPYQSQKSLSLTMGHVQPYLSLEGYCSRDPIATTANDYYPKANPIIFTAMKDYQHTVNPCSFGNTSNSVKDKMEISSMDSIQHDRRIFVENAHLVASKSSPLISDHHVHRNACMLGNYSAQWTACCKIYSPCPQHQNMGSYGSQTARIQQFQVSCEPQQQQQLHNSLLNVSENLVEDEAINFADNSPGAASSRIDDECNIESGSS